MSNVVSVHPRSVRTPYMQVDLYVDSWLYICHKTGEYYCFGLPGSFSAKSSQKFIIITLLLWTK